ncbi:hypothetical protein JY651_47270 [Pyxidicoccus parkwayensis]|uniref:Lipoprotein n=1 Tax=Pyxidicoccus parkwayensis TaxID=2813578 RepID=A0ABX7P1R6_9BACT|nr:hypothetical protein [Pyxidicoccus parkwaysis]QSQ22628.1 hypothetical protein JY651_47270 [Pyxidicoccus parkwaysis]
MDRRLLVVALWAWTFAACSATPSVTTRQVKGTYDFTKHPERGLLILSTRFSSDCKSGETPSTSLAYRDDQSSASKGGIIPVASRPEEAAFQDPPGYFVVQEQEGREYMLRELKLDHLKGATTDVQLPFAVEPGKAVYLGEVHVRYLNCDSFPTVSLQVTDQWERDSRLLQARLPNVRPEDVVKRLLPPSWPEQPQASR